MKVVSFMAGIPANNKNPEKPEILSRFIQGVKLNGDQGQIWTHPSYTECDVAVVQGFLHDQSPNTPHLKVRRQVIDSQITRNKRTVFVDSNLFLYRDPGNTKRFLRYSFDGVFPSTGEYCWDNPNFDRWDIISKSLNIQLKPQRQSGNHILICMQRNGGWSMKGQDIWVWLENVLVTLKKFTDRPIVVRTHPGDRHTKIYVQRNEHPVKLRTMPGVKFSDVEKRSLIDDLNNAWATVVFNSSPSVASAIEGVPIFVGDKEDCQAGDVANTDLSKIETPLEFDREQWIRKISMCHWNFEELSNGTCWKHMRNYVKI